ncbi:DUF6247 family protein [Streptomyces gamaensis]|uniref:DUF6247 family protein n=1 Tax=Streptomyces gamaensis TaxID=1763542 RepID=A0ABW0Z354_9ACTN
MTSQEGTDVPLIPQPANNPEAVRAAVARVMRASLPTFDAEHAEALREARRAGNAAPMRRLVEQWAFWVAIERYPQRAARLHQLEADAEAADTMEEARAAVSGIGRIVDLALTEAGIHRGPARGKADRGPRHQR